MFARLIVRLALSSVIFAASAGEVEAYLDPGASFTIPTGDSFLLPERTPVLTGSSVLLPTLIERKSEGTGGERSLTQVLSEMTNGGNRSGGGGRRSLPVPLTFREGSDDEAVGGPDSSGTSHAAAPAEELVPVRPESGHEAAGSPIPRTGMPTMMLLIASIVVSSFLFLYKKFALSLVLGGASSRNTHTNLQVKSGIAAKHRAYPSQKLVTISGVLHAKPYQSSSSHVA